MSTEQHVYDQGPQFALWADPVADLMYRGAMPYILDSIPFAPHVLDLGGGNGQIRDWLPTYSHLLTVDTDPAKEPDVLADVMTWTPPPTPAEELTGVLRYVLHYLTDEQVLDLLEHLATYLTSVVIIQFANESPAEKAAASADSDLKRWRTPTHLLNLLTDGEWVTSRINRLDYTVTPEFYAARLGHPSERPHAETLLGIHLTRRQFGSPA